MTPKSAFPKRFPAWLKGLPLMHDSLAKNCLHDNIPCVTLMLHIILDRRDLEVTAVTVQKVLPNKFGGHEVRFDIFAKDAAGRLFDIEMQLGCTVDELTKRIRFYCSLLDVSHLQQGESYEQLPETWVIFILDRDMFGRNKPLYRIERCVLGEKADGEENKELLFDDGAHIVVVNGTMREGDTDLSRLLHDLNCSDPEEMHHEVLRNAVRKLKTTKKGRRKMYASYEEIEAEMRAEGHAKGRAEGRAEGRKDTLHSIIRNLLAKGFPLETIAELVSLSLAEVQALAAEAAAAKS